MTYSLFATPYSLMPNAKSPDGAGPGVYRGPLSEWRVANGE
jgi:hypothetical protein